MSRDPKYDVLFEPVAIGPKTMRNRFYQTPHCTGFGEAFPGAQAAFREMKAEGGWAVVNTEATTILPSDDFSGFTLQSRLWDSSDARNWSLMCDRVHEHGSLAGIELHAGGSVQTGFDSRVPAPAPSQILDEALFLGACYEMTKDDIRVVQRAYVRAAKLARVAGFDIVNVHGAEAAGLPVQFLMRKTNRRTDEYGGSIENRARFWLETLEQVRDAVGSDCAIAARFCVDTLHGTDLGIRAEVEGIAFIELADHLVDFWDLQVGGSTVAEWVKDAGPGRFYPEDFQAGPVAVVRGATRKPIVGVGRFTSPDLMVELIRSGRLDVIGAARPSIADPFMPRKIEEGRLDEIRQCIGCNVCVSRVNAGWRLVCTQNPTSGEEYRRGWHPERFDPAANADENVLVVGAGLAGMECAIVLGRRGFRRVHLVEAEPEPGGHWRWISRFTGLGEWARAIAWRRVQLDRLPNVELVAGERLDAEAVREYGADVVVTATGSSWAGDGFGPHNPLGVPGADAALPAQATPEQLMLGQKELPGETVLVYDTEGYVVAVSLAERLAEQGKRVRLVTALPGPAMYMHYTGELIHMIPRLVGLGVELVASHVVAAIDPGGVRGHPVGLPGAPVEWQADAVVLVTQRLSDDGLYRALVRDPGPLEREGIRAVYRIGDCVAPRLNVADAIFDGHRLAREIDTEDPSVPLPYIREHRILGATDEDYDGVVRAGVYAPRSVRG